MLQGAHVVQTVSQLDDNDANVFSHRQEHTAKVFGLLFGFAVEVELSELGDTLY